HLVELVALRRVAPRRAAQRPSEAAHSVRSTRTGLSQRDKHQGASGYCDGLPIWWWEWSRCDRSARAERAVRVIIGHRQTKAARRSARRDGSQREPFHLVEPFHRSVWMRPFSLDGPDGRAHAPAARRRTPSALKGVSVAPIN